jgi:hypothetical protein
MLLVLQWIQSLLFVIAYVQYALTMHIKLYFYRYQLKCGHVKAAS